MNSHSTHFSGNLDCFNSVALKSNRALLVNDNLLLQTKRNVHRGWTILKEMYGKPVSLQMNNTNCSAEEMLLLIDNRYCSDYKDLTVLLQFSFAHQVQYAYFVHKSSKYILCHTFSYKNGSHFVHYCALQRMLVAILTQISGNGNNSDITRAENGERTQLT